jgi:hypothetical protein
MAQRDLDAALQLLADRAQYITGASGAAIALRRDGMADMLCRASTGTNAPELGALLSTEFGLSGESVRTKRALRCDDAERDARVNREVCRQLGIASVVVMPVVDDDQVLGVFELFSGKANAFGERDLTAIQRLSEMVETAVRLAHAGEPVRKKQANQGVAAQKSSKRAVQEGQFISDLVVERKSDQAAIVKTAGGPATSDSMLAAARTEVPLEKTASSVRPKAAPPKKPLFWSAAPTSEAEAVKPADSQLSEVPPVLRGLRKCEACGFPVTEARTLCVECEEKKWRGELRRQVRNTTARVPVPSASFAAQASAAAAPGMAKAPSASAETGLSPSKAVVPGMQAETSKTVSEADKNNPPVSEIALHSADTPEPDFVLSAGGQPSQSWLAANKYVLGALLVIAAAAAAAFFLR